MSRATLDKYLPPIHLRKFVQVLLSEDVKGNKSEASRQSGVDRNTFYYHFQRYPKFRQWFSEQCDTFLGINEGIPSFMLMKKVLDGDVQAIRTYFELRGKIGRHAEFGTVPTQIVIAYGHTQPTVQVRQPLPQEANGG